MAGTIFRRGLDEVRDVLHSNHRYRSIYAAYDAPQKLLLATLVAAYRLQSLRLQLVALLGKPLHYLPALCWTDLERFVRYAQHRKEYKNVPTDKCG